MTIPIIRQGFFRVFWEKGPYPNWGFFYPVYTVFYTGYTHKFMECSFHRSLVTSKQTLLEFDKSL
jgi:hypothetical protein